MTILNEMKEAINTTLETYREDGVPYYPDFERQVEVEEFAKRLLPHLTSLFINNLNPELRDDHFPDFNDAIPLRSGS